MKIYGKKVTINTIFTKITDTILGKKNFHYSRSEQDSDIRKFIFDKKMYGKYLDIGGGRASWVQSTSLIPTEAEESVTINIDEEYNPDYVMDATQMTFPDNSFDVVIAISVMEHVSNPELFLSEVYRVLKKGGYLIIQTPFLVKVHAFPSDFWRYTEEGLNIKLQEQGFEDILTNSWGNKYAAKQYLDDNGHCRRRRGKKLLSYGNDKIHLISVWAFARK